MDDKLLRSLKKFAEENNLKYTETTHQITFDISNRCSTSPQMYANSVKEVVDYLNQKACKNFRHTSQSNRKIIIARLSEYTMEDIKSVIDTKVREWKGTKFEKYLQPSTLFRASNFENYINQTEVTNPLAGFFGEEW